MKKTYNNPSMRVISIHVGHLLAGSGIDPQNNQAGLSTKSATEGVEAGGRFGWYDEGEE
jgi:hypothetical protein